MTVSTTGLRESYSGNGVTTAFSFPYKFLEDSDLIVTVIDADGVETTQTLTSDYTVSGAGGASGGTVTMVTAPASDETLLIVRALEITQETDYITGDSFPAETHETALDRLTLIAQQLNYDTARSIKVKEIDSESVDTELPSPVADNFLGWNDTATGLENKSLDDFTPSGAIDVNKLPTILTNVVALEAATLTAGQLVETKGYYTAGDGGQARYLIKTAVDYGGTPDGYGDHTLANGNVAVLQYEGAVNVKWFGAVGDGITEDATAIQAAVNIGSIDIPKDVEFLCTTVIEVPANRTISGGGKLITNTTNGVLSLSSNSTVKGISIEASESGTVTATSIAIKGHGTYNSGSAPTYIENIIIEDNQIEGFGNDAIDLKYVQNFSIKNNNMTNCARSFVEIITGINGIISGNKLDTITVGTTDDSYGIIVTRDASTSSLTDNPRSQYVDITNNVILDNPTYGGVTTSAGNYIKIANNIIKNCRVPVEVVSSSYGGTDDFSSNYVVVDGNILEGTNEDPCIRLMPGAFGVRGTPADESFGCVVSNNVCTKGGSVTDIYTAAIFVQDSTNVIVSSNTIVNANRVGIYMYHTNKNINVSGNTIIDPFHDTYTLPTGIRVGGYYNVGLISGNTIVRDDTTLATYVCVQGISTLYGSTGNNIPVNNNVSTATTPYYLPDNPATAVNF